MSSRLRNRLSILAVLLAFAALGVWRGEALWTWATTRVVYERYGMSGPGSPEILAAHRVSRWGSDRSLEGWQRHWHVETGFLAKRWYATGELELDYEEVSEGTTWGHTGRISQQVHRGEEWQSPPWRCGETDQAEPTAHWIQEGVSFEEWWETVGGQP